MGANRPERDTISPVRRVFLVVLMACGGAPPPEPALKNVAAGDVRPVQNAPVCGVAKFSNRGPNNLYGAACDPQLRQWLEGVTVVVTGPNLVGERVFLSDEHGVFEIQIPPGDYTVTYYYADCTWVRNHHVDGADAAPIYDPLIQKGCK